MFESIQECLAWVMSRRKGEMTFSSFEAIMKKLGDPQDRLKVIHVAGTNGKGSTVTYLRDLLMSQGFTVGTLQSPHYLTHLDRIRFNGENIPEETFLRIVNKYYDFFAKNRMGMFEIDYVVMCEYFLIEEADYVITEVGIGGRLDSTNVIHHPVLSVITTIGYDHMERLGNTLEEICKEKCGIIKTASAVLAGDLSASLKEIVQKTAEEKGSVYYEMKLPEEIGERRFLYDGEVYEISSYGKYQYYNASLALEALKILSEREDFIVDREKAKEAVRKSLWKGRFEVVSHDPTVILDGAHNIHGIDALVKSLDALKGRKLVIFAALKRKEYGKMIEELKKHADEVVLTSFDHPEAVSGEDVSGDISFTDDYMGYMKRRENDFDVIVFCGSLYFISEIAEKMQ